MKTVLIIGAGPSGLTAAYELLKKGSGKYKVIVLEETGTLGGISRTVEYKGNRMDMGGHRFFSKVQEVNDWWAELLPVQGSPAWDDVELHREQPVEAGGPDPEKTDRVMLMRTRVSRILFDSKFYDYPISLKWETFKNMGFLKTMQVGFSYVFSMIHKLKEDNLENFYINRFGRKLYSMFFEYYTENLWGRHPSEIDASWGAQRVKGLSVVAILKDIFSKIFHVKNRKVETSLIEKFKYPKLGPGELWELTAQKVQEMGGTIILNAHVSKVEKAEDGHLTSLTYVCDGQEHTLAGDEVISSMPIKDLVAGMNGVPQDIRRIADGLPYRDYITLGVLIPKLKLKNQTKMPTLGDRVPDCWVYVQDRTVRMGRFQIYNNWSPYMVKDNRGTVWMGLEYFVNEGDEFWQMKEEDFAHFAIAEMVKLGLIDSEKEVLDYHEEKVKKAYPAYFDTYSEMDKLKDYLSAIPNLYCVGRNGQHRYNNIDHSMVTAFRTADAILSGNRDKAEIWAVNTEKEYHEAKEEKEDAKS